jgi:hypothetical protein
VQTARELQQSLSRASLAPPWCPQRRLAELMK